MMKHFISLNAFFFYITPGFYIKMIHLKQKEKMSRIASFGYENAAVQHGQLLFLFIKHDKIRKFHNTSFKELLTEHLTNVVLKTKTLTDDATGNGL